MQVTEGYLSFYQFIIYVGDINDVINVCVLPRKPFNPQVCMYDIAVMRVSLSNIVNGYMIWCAWIL